MPYDLIGQTRPEVKIRQEITDDLRKYNVSRMVLSPSRWATFTAGISLQWEAVRFEKQEIKKIPADRRGVYSFVVLPGIARHPLCSYLLYIGKADKQSLQERVANYFYEVNNPKGRAPVQDMILNWESYLWVCYATVDEVQEIDGLENSLLEAFVPPVNQQYKGTFGQAVKAWKT